MRKRTFESYINEFKKIHKDKYKYPQQEIKRNSKIKVICPVHGEFLINTSSHLRGFGCPKCSIKKKQPRKTKEDHVLDFRMVHELKYDYSLFLNSKEKFKTNDKIPIICPKHGIFYQTIRDHKQGQGCPKCAKEKIKQPLKSLEEHINDFKKIHKNKYDYSLIKKINNTFDKIPIICPKHGIFYQKVNDHKQGAGCPKCKESKGERKIRHYLEENNINYEYQYPIKIKNHKKPLYFDFYLPKQNIAIEFDGIFHYKDHPKQSVEIQKKRDELKNQYCKENNIKLIRIPYWEYDSIEKILKRELN